MPTARARGADASTTRRCRSSSPTPTSRGGRRRAPAARTSARDRRVARRVRRRAPFTVMPMKGVVVGIDAGGTKTRAFAVGRDGEVVGRGAGGGGNLLSSPDPQGSIGAALSEALGGRDADA